MSWRDRLLGLLGLARGPIAPETPEEPKPHRDTARPSAEPPAVGTRAAKAASEGRSARITAVIGLDLGTSCTKCVIGVVGRAIAVPFAGLTAAHTPYLLPTQLWLGVDRSLSLRSSNGALPVIGIKVSLMERPDTTHSLGEGREATPVLLVAAYVGQVLRHARDWLLAEKRDLLGNAEVSWQLNVGLPAKSHDDQGVHDAFRRAVHAGWALSQRQGAQYLGVCAEAVRAVSGSSYALTGISTAAINLVPE